MTEFVETAIKSVILATPKRFGDARGYFSETYNRKLFREGGIDVEFVQDNQSLSRDVGTIRGLHFQAPPYAQSKLVRVLSGAIIDVAVDARKSSPTYGQHVKEILSAENGVQLFVPQGFLHGFITLEPDTIVAYKVDNFYDFASDGAVMWNDPELNIDWGVTNKPPVISEKDSKAQSWGAFQSPFG